MSQPGTPRPTPQENQDAPAGPPTDAMGVTPDVLKHAAAGSQTNDSGPDTNDPRVASLVDSYWRKNLTVMLALLVVWAMAGPVCGILIADWLNQWRVGGFPVGFWFAQQGSIIIFVLVILVYCIIMNKLDGDHHRQLEALKQQSTGGAR